MPQIAYTSVSPTHRDNSSLHDDDDDEDFSQFVTVESEQTFHDSILNIF